MYTCTVSEEFVRHVQCSMHIQCTKMLLLLCSASSFSIKRHRKFGGIWVLTKKHDLLHSKNFALSCKFPKSKCNNVSRVLMLLPNDSTLNIE